MRPIAVGSAYRRLTAKTAAKHATALLAQVFKPKQLGVGVKGGCEAAIHAAREFIQSSTSNPSFQILIKVDVSNAFNSIHRTSFLNQILQNCPAIYPLMRQAYGFSSPLFYGETRILSQTGLHQGDPLASLAFSLAINPVIRNISCPFNVWYLDDGVFGGELQEVARNLQELERGFAQIGLNLNHKKCEATILSSDSNPDATMVAIRRVVPGIAGTAKDSLSLLGSPLEVGGLDDSVSSCASKVKLICNRVQNLDAHWALFFLARYTSAPRLNHLLRSSPAYLQPSKLQSIDLMVRSTLTTCTNVQLSDQAWAQASLPLRHGGLGVRKVADLALPCYIASLHATRDLTQQILTGLPAGNQDVPPSLSAALEAFRIRHPDSVIPEADDAEKQRNWDDVSCSTTFQEIVDTAHQVHRARLKAAKEPHSGAWLNATPLPRLGLHLDDATVRISVALRVGATICESHTCRCGRRVDTLGHHGLSCQFSEGRLPRHANLNDVVKRALAAAGIPSWLEPVGLDRGDGRRPDGVTIFPYHQGKCLTWDATCVDTFSSTAVVDSAITPGSAAMAAEERKRNRYSTLTDRYLFEPVAIETTGVMGPSTRSFLQRLGRQMSTRTGNSRETSWLIERVSLAVVRGNSASISATGCLAS